MGFLSAVPAYPDNNSQYFTDSMDSWDWNHRDHLTLNNAVSGNCSGDIGIHGAFEDAPLMVDMPVISLTTKTPLESQALTRGSGGVLESKESRSSSFNGAGSPIWRRDINDSVHSLSVRARAVSENIRPAPGLEKLKTEPIATVQNLESESSPSPKGPKAILVIDIPEKSTRTFSASSGGTLIGSPSNSPSEASSNTPSSSNTPQAPEAAPRQLFADPQGSNTLVLGKWMKSFRRSKQHKLRPKPYLSNENTPGKDGSIGSHARSSRTGTKTVSSSMKLVTTIKTASLTLASLSITGDPTRRKSSGGGLDNDTVKRMRERRFILEELINTEEYYIADLKSLINIYFPILNDSDYTPTRIKDSIKRNLFEILGLHEELLSEIFRGLPVGPSRLHDSKGKSLDVSPQVGEMARSHLLANPAATTCVAAIFNKMIKGFFVYEQYVANHKYVNENVKQYIHSRWSSCPKGSEAMAGMTTSTENQKDYGKRALALQDLTIKPIQRLSKYPLLFKQLLSSTPVIDCPEANRWLEKVYNRLDEAASEINRSTRKTRERIERTWLLQDRLVFQEKPDFAVRLLGHIVLCGTLHIVWQKRVGFVGEYLACLLYKSYLLMATVSNEERVYKVKFAITLATAHIEEANQGGGGLQCHSTPFSWKIVFKGDHHTYELLASACSAEEEYVWRKHILDRAVAESQDYHDYNSIDLNIFAPVTSDIKPIGNFFGRPWTLSRHPCMGGPSGLNPSKAEVIRVVINNTHALPDGAQSRTPSLSRSPSSLSINGVPVFSPKRSERKRVESRLADVWSKDLLPFGAMQPQSSSLIRRLSKVSLGSHADKWSIHSQHSQSELIPENTWEFGENDIIGMVRSASTSPSKLRGSTNSLQGSSPCSRTASLSSKLSGIWKKEIGGYDRKSGSRRRSASPTKDENSKISMMEEIRRSEESNFPKCLQLKKESPNVLEEDLNKITCVVSSF